MTKNVFFIAIILLLNYCVEIYSENAYYLVGIKSNYKINYDEADEKIKNKIDKLVNDKMNDIYEVIEEHKDSYVLNGEIDKKLEELNSSTLKKRSNQKILFNNKIRHTDGFVNSSNVALNSASSNIAFNSASKNSTRITTNSVFKNSNVEYILFESNLVSHVCPISDYYIINVYLSDKTAGILKKFNNVVICEKASRLRLFDIDEKPQTKKYYDIDAIKKETNWSDVSVQPFNYPGTPNYLSMISQGNLLPKGKSYDENFYYPSTAGQGIDIYLIDEGILTNHEDFNTYEGTPYNRTITCDAISKENEIIIPTTEEEKKACWANTNPPDHGIGVSSTAGGTLFGVAKKANLHMIACELWDFNVLRSLDFILQNAKPHKTVINLSFGRNRYLKLFEDKINDMVNMGFIIIVAAGNGKSNCCGNKNSNNFYFFSGYNSTITVGSVESEIKNNRYTASSYTNYGNCVDIFAPGRVIVPVVGENTTDYTEVYGTSFSSPMVAGVAASIMSEHPEIQFNQELMRKTLIDMSIKDAIVNLKSSDTPNRFINNGKKINFSNDGTLFVSECGISAGNATCSEGCCSKDGKCIKFNENSVEECFIENGCQSEFGYCITIKKAEKECKTALKEHEECFIDSILDYYNYDNNNGNFDGNYDDDEYIDNDDDDNNNKNDNKEELMNICSKFKAPKCKTFFDNLTNDKHVCSFVKKRKSFELINDIKIIYRNYEYGCSTFYEKLCTSELDKCFITGSVVNVYDTVNETCANFKSNECLEFYQNGLNNTSACNLIDPSFYTPVEPVYFKYYYDETEEICRNVKENPDYPTELCRYELYDYNDCEFDISDDLTEEEIIKKCTKFNSKDCIAFFESIDSSVLYPMCHINSKTEKIVKKIHENSKKIDKFCKKRITNKIKKKIIKSCEEEIQKYKDCPIDFNPAMSSEEASQKCEIYKSKDCGELNYIEYNLNCQYAEKFKNIQYITPNTDSVDYYYYRLCGEKRINLESFCEFYIEEDYKDCLLDEPSSNKNELTKQCKNFLSDKCQVFYENQEDLLLECYITGRFEKPDVIKINDSKWNHFNDTCSSVDLSI